MSLQIGTNVEQVSLLGNASVTVANVTGDALYYADYRDVSAASHQGSLTAGQSATFTATVYVVSASFTSVTIAFPPAPSDQPPVGVPNGLAGLDSTGHLPLAQNSLAVVSDSSGVNAPLVDGSANRLVNVPPWQASTAYPAGYCVVQAGIVYTANSTFTSAATFVLDAANWTALTAAGTELAYAEITSAPAAFTTTVADISGLSVTFTAPARPVILQFWAQTVQQLGSTGAPKIILTDSSNNTVITNNVPNTLAANAFSQQLFASVRISGLTPGTSVTYKARGVTSVGTAQLTAGNGASTGSKCYLQALQA